MHVTLPKNLLKNFKLSVVNDRTKINLPFNIFFANFAQFISKYLTTYLISNFFFTQKLSTNFVQKPLEEFPPKSTFFPFSTSRKEYFPAKSFCNLKLRLRDMGGGSIIDALKKNDGLKALE
jgi:hypothetical protein